MDSEVKRLTGTEREFTEEEVKSFFLKCLDDDRYDFLIFSPEGKVIGESVINEIDRESCKANFRIAFFTVSISEGVSVHGRLKKQ